MDEEEVIERNMLSSMGLQPGVYHTTAPRDLDMSTITQRLGGMVVITCDASEECVAVSLALTVERLSLFDFDDEHRVYKESCRLIAPTPDGGAADGLIIKGKLFAFSYGVTFEPERLGHPIPVTVFLEVFMDKESADSDRCVCILLQTVPPQRAKGAGIVMGKNFNLW